MIKKLITLFKLGRKVAKSDILRIASKFKKPPLAVTILFQLLSISFSKKEQKNFNKDEGERLSSSLENMGTTFIKLGQFLATRPDIIGEELSSKLENLQDRLPAFSINQAKEIIRDDLGDETYNSIINLSEPVGEIFFFLFYMLDNLLFPIFTSLFALFMLVLFFVTSSDSGSLVIDTITSGGKSDPPRIQRVIWAVIQGLLAIVLLVGGGSYALSAIQSGAISMAAPFIFILIAATVSLLRGIYIEVYDSQKRIEINGR